MCAAESYVQRGICFVELDRTEVRSLSHLKRTVPGLVWKRTETSCSVRSRSADLVHIEVRWLHSHQRKRTEPRDQTCLVRTKCCWCESTKKLLKQKYLHVIHRLQQCNCILNTNYFNLYSEYVTPVHVFPYCTFTPHAVKDAKSHSS